MYMATSTSLDNEWPIAQQGMGINVIFLAEMYLLLTSTCIIFFLFLGPHVLSLEAQQSAQIHKSLHSMLVGISLFEKHVKTA